ncbi:putative reverse transcriptase domain-containing protein [Tanacetum coccineum]
MRQRRWIELFSDYDCEIRYHPGKANVVADALSRRHRVKPKRVRAMNMTLQSSIKDKIPAAQKEAVNESAGLQKGLDKMIEHRSDGTLYYLDQIWVPLKGEQPEIPVWKWEEIAIDFVTKLPRTSSGHDNSIWVIVDRLTKFAHFLPIHEYFKMDRLARPYLNEIVARHGLPISIISDYDGMPRFFKEENHQNEEIYTKISVKEAQGSKKVNATLVIRMPPFHPTANIQDPMIKRDQWPRLEAAKERVKDLEASSLAYKRSLPLTHRDI